jgi:glycosyltransferase involved in cell wall biosynthesis
MTFQPPRGSLNDFPDYQRLAENGIKVHTMRNLLRACAFVFRRSQNFDIIHVDGCWVPICILAVLIAKLTGLRSAVTPHETLTLEERRRTGSLLRAALKLILTRYYQKIADCIIYASALECRDSPQHPNSTVIPHPVFDDSRSVVPLAIRNGFADPGSVRLGYLGRFHPKKHLERIIAASKRTVNINLLLAGDGSGAYEQTIRAMDDGKGAISWLGFVQKERREAFFRDIDFLVLTSEYECFGMAAAEALVRGIPVIVTQRVGVADDVQRTGSGLVVAGSVDSLVSAFEQCTRLTPDQYLQLQDGALKAAARYSYSVHGQSQVHAYRSMLENRRASAARITTRKRGRA